MWPPVSSVPNTGSDRTVLSPAVALTGSREPSSLGAGLDKGLF